MKLVSQNKVTIEQVKALQTECAKLPQCEMPTDHYFSGGMYCRKVTSPATCLIIGKIHKKDHFFLCAKGEIIVSTDNGMKRLLPGDVVQSKAGTKRVAYSVVESIGITFHVTDKTDFNELEKELVEPEDLCLYDFGNNLIGGSK